MKRILAALPILAFANQAAAAPPASRISTVSGYEVAMDYPSDEPGARRIPLASDSLYGMNQAPGSTVAIDYFWSNTSAHITDRFTARLCRRSHTGTIVCGADWVDVDPPERSYRTAWLDTSGLMDPNGTSPFDSYFVDYKVESTAPDGSPGWAGSDTRIVGIGVYNSGQAAPTLPSSRSFTVSEAAFDLAPSDGWGRRGYRASLPHDEVYGFRTSTPPDVHVHFATATLVPYYVNTVGPSFEPVDYTKYDIDYDVKACRRSWNSGTVVCGPDANLHNPPPGSQTSLVASTAAIASPGNSIYDYYYVEASASIAYEWTSVDENEYYPPTLLPNPALEGEASLFGATVVHRTKLTDFPASNRRNHLLASNGRRFPLLNDSIYGFSAATTGPFKVDYYLGENRNYPDAVRTDLAMRFCRESYTGSTISCGPDNTRGHQTFGVYASISVSTAGIVGGSPWDYYYGQWSEVIRYTNGTSDSRGRVGPFGVSGEYRLQ